MATKKKTTPKQYRGVTLNFDKGTGRYFTEDRQIFLYKDRWEVPNGSWAAGVIVDRHHDEDGIIVYGSAETVQEAIDIALDNALECIDNHMKTVAEQKTNLLKIRNS